MKKLLYLLAIIGLGFLTFACSGKTDTKENEKKPLTTAASNVSANNAANQPGTKQTDGDADDVRQTTANIAPTSNANVKTKKDADDIRQSNSNQRRADADDRSKRDADDRNRQTNSRRDADDYGKRDNDGDADDN